MDSKKEQRVAQLLFENGLKRTKLRLDLLNLFIKTQNALSYIDIQNLLGKAIDKSSLYRNLSAFEKADLIHSITDDSNMSKYAFGPSQLTEKNILILFVNAAKQFIAWTRSLWKSLRSPKAFNSKKYKPSSRVFALIAKAFGLFQA